MIYLSHIKPCISKVLVQIKLYKRKISKILILLLFIGLIYYFLFACPSTKLTQEGLIDFLSHRNPPSWLVPNSPGEIIDVELTKNYKRLKFAEFKKKVYEVQLHVKNNLEKGQDIYDENSINGKNNLSGENNLDQEDSVKEFTRTTLKDDLATAAKILVEFWAVTIVTVPSQDPNQEQPQKMIIGEGSQPINLDDRVLRWQKEIEAAAEKYDLEPALLAAVIEQESGGESEAMSPVGAIGLMQLMPSTADLMGVNPYDPVQNIDGGAHYLQQQLENFGSVQTALAAYNAGPGEVENGHWIKIPEIINYVQKMPVLIRKYEQIWQENSEKS